MKIISVRFWWLRRSRTDGTPNALNPQAWPQAFWLRNRAGTIRVVEG
jgi:hypothetical protein